jgi:outer membrane receptor protein involved in Fe transport
LYDPELKVVNFGGELGYTIGEKFSLISNLTFNQYKSKVNDKAWGLIPLEFKTNMRIQVLKDLYVNSTIYAFDGPWALTKNGRRNMPTAADLSAGLEFRIVNNIKLWAQFNNIFNKPYERWNQYPVYGFNFLGGVVFSFAQKK